MSIANENFKQVDFSDYTNIPALREYIDRIGAEQRNFKRFVVRKREGRYGRDLATVTIDEAGTIAVFCKNPDDQADFDPTPEERAAIAAKFKELKIVFPKPVLSNRIDTEGQRRKLGVDTSRWFVIVDRTQRDKVIMCQQRIDDAEGNKSYLPWTPFPDGWRNMEPDGPLPIWKPDKRRHKSLIMLHEGPKAAQFCDNLVHNPALEWRDRAAKHPWYDYLKHFEHWGWIGGAPNPERTNWDELKGEFKEHGVLRVCVIADNDDPGVSAIRPIAKELKGFPLWALRFDSQFPAAFDLADPFPEDDERFFKNGKYVGPQPSDLICSATWATKAIPVVGTSGKVTIKHVMREAFLAEWCFTLDPTFFINKHRPHRRWSEVEFNNAVRPFSDVEDTARLLKQHFECQSEGIGYVPGNESFFVTEKGRRLINTWMPTDIRPISYSKGEDKPWLDFMEMLIPVESDRNDTLKWCATLFARPDIRMHIALLLMQQMQGVGKGTLMDNICAPLVGYQNVSWVSEKDIVEQQFNHWQGHKRLAIVREIYQGSSKKAYHNLKEIITDNTAHVHEKHVKPYDVPNWIHLIMSSNSNRPLQVAREDRRYLIPRVTSEKPTPTYWRDFNAWLAGDGLGIILQWAIDYVKNVGHFETHDEAPMSERKDRLIEASMSDGQRLIHQLALVSLSSVEERRKDGEERGLYVVETNKIKESENVTAREALTAELIVLTDREVRSWLAAQRGMQTVNSPTLESLLTIEEVLTKAGMFEIAEKKVRGLRARWFANKQITPEQLPRKATDPGVLIPVEWN
jgi:hypothetical protein